MIPVFPEDLGMKVLGSSAWEFSNLFTYSNGSAEGDIKLANYHQTRNHLVFCCRVRLSFCHLYGRQLTNPHHVTGGGGGGEGGMSVYKSAVKHIYAYHICLEMCEIT